MSSIDKADDHQAILHISEREWPDLTQHTDDKQNVNVNVNVNLFSA